MIHSTLMKIVSRHNTMSIISLEQVDILLELHIEDVRCQLLNGKTYFHLAKPVAPPGQGCTA